MTISRVLIANRGEIAVRIIRACQALQIESVLAVSHVDRDSLAARMANRSVCIGASRAEESYLNLRLIVAAAHGTGCDAIHPGYGFLSESPELAEACRVEGLIFVGPQPDQIRQMGNKLRARAIAKRCGLPTLPASERVHSYEEALSAAKYIGFPLMIKAAAGGGGRGMKIITNVEELGPAFRSATAEARAAFNDDTLYFERYIQHSRHIEVQILGDGSKNLVHLGERDCSLQRRHQKLLEETPAPNLSEALRERIREAAVTLAQEIAYENAGTVEFIVDQDRSEFYFLEMNTRIQVEHPITEFTTGIDLVQQQFRIAKGETLGISQADIHFSGHALECRINAELPDHGFRPDPGTIMRWVPPPDSEVRIDTHCYAGYDIPPFYDSLLAKIIVGGSSREQAVERMQHALERFEIAGVGTTLPFLRFVMMSPEFTAGAVSTQLVDRLNERRLGMPK